MLTNHKSKKNKIIMMNICDSRNAKINTVKEILGWGLGLTIF